MKILAMSAFSRAALPILTRLDPEVAHDLGLASMRLLQPLWRSPRAVPGLQLDCLGLRFSHPVGLAAGFDKNADFIDALGAAGFSHIELGTVTPRPQSGNAKPRMFRISRSFALINRMGFNNKGVDHLVAQLSRSRYAGIRGISIGKNADTPMDHAHEDYLKCMRKVYLHADYIAVNVSSPNTARLRELQSSAGLSRILGALLEERCALQRLHGKRVPLLVKVAPDLAPEQIAQIALELRSLPMDGVIATNTSIDKSSLGEVPLAKESGGLSGAPIHEKSMQVIAQLRAELGSAFPIIGVGGIVSAQAARQTLLAGANLVQIYTGFAYRGPTLIDEILSELSA